MPGLMSRASVVVKAKLSKLLDRAENPTETLDYSYEKQLELLQNVKRGVADVTTAKKRLQLQTEQLEKSIVKLDSQARDALAAGREDLARTALERKSGVQQQLQSLDEQVTGLEAQQEKLVSSQKQLQAKIESFRSQKEVIKAQYSAAEAQVKIGEAATGIGEQMADTGPRDPAREGQDRADAGARGRPRRAGRLRRPRGSDCDRQRHRSRARADLVDLAGRPRAGADEGRFGPGSGGGERRAGRREHGVGRGSEGVVPMIVRVMGEGQFRIGEDVAAELNELDEQASKAVEAGDQETLNRLLEQMAQKARDRGEPLDVADLTPSDGMIPPADLTLEEARSLFEGEGLIPDLPTPPQSRSQAEGRGAALRRPRRRPGRAGDPAVLTLVCLSFAAYIA